MNLEIESKLKEVRDYVAEKHATQMYGDEPYMVHLDMVFKTLKDLLDKQIGTKCEVSESVYLNLLTSAYCHDIVEDQDVTVDELKEKYNEDVAQMVWAVTGVGKTRKECTQDTVEKLLKKISAVDVKIIDRYCNLMCSINFNKISLVERYLSEVKDYKEVFEFALPDSQELFRKEVERAKKYLGYVKMKGTESTTGKLKI